MNRQVLRQLAEERARDAWALQYNRQWSGLYYMAGYVVECGLKACIARLTNQDDFPDNNFARDCFTHDIGDLIRLAGLQSFVKYEIDNRTPAGRNWLIVKDWNEQARYQFWSETVARKLFSAVTEANTGVLTWIKNHW